MRLSKKRKKNFHTSEPRFYEFSSRHKNLFRVLNFSFRLMNFFFHTPLILSIVVTFILKNLKFLINL